MARFFMGCSKSGRLTAKLFRFVAVFAIVAFTGDTQERASAQDGQASLFSLNQSDTGARGAVAVNTPPAAKLLANPGQQAAAAETTAALPAVVAVERKNDKIKLSGIVATQEQERLVLGMIAATFPGLSISNKLRVEKDVANSENWLSGVSFTLRQLAMLKSGRVQVQDNLVSVAGEAAAGSGYEAVHRALRQEVPAGLVVTTAAVKPPPAAYVWLAQLQAGNVSISGRVPDRAAHQTLSELVTKLFPSARFDDGMEVAEGAPDSWLKAAWISVYALQFLQSGSVSIDENTIRIEGAPSADSSLAQIQELSASLPSGFRMENNVIVSQSLDGGLTVKR